ATGRDSKGEFWTKYSGGELEWQICVPLARKVCDVEALMEEGTTPLMMEEMQVPAEPLPNHASEPICLRPNTVMGQGRPC
ncbi:hypothetical protein Ancab_034707, partial [Ancistrocladus abbreviatus]